MSKKYTFDSMLQFLKYHLYLKDKASSNELEIPLAQISIPEFQNCNMIIVSVF